MTLKFAIYSFERFIKSYNTAPKADILTSIIAIIIINILLHWQPLIKPLSIIIKLFDILKLDCTVVDT